MSLLLLLKTKKLKKTENRIVHTIVPFLLPVFLSLIWISLPLFNRPVVFPEEPVIAAKSLSQSLLRKSKEIHLEADQWLSLRSELIFLENINSLSKSDSFVLVVDLHDSIVALRIKGVNVLESNISSFRTSKGFTHLQKAGALPLWLSQPFRLIDAHATVQKLPYKIIQAPKDSVEANKLKFKNIVLEKQDVYCEYEFSRHLQLDVYQAEKRSPTDWRAALFRIFNYVDNAYFSSCIDILKLRWPVHRFHISLEIPYSDAQAIYRALPGNALAVVRM
jgi:hypothetical protein